MNEPTQIGKYRVIAQCGQGGMATVYRARDTVLDREVALKLMHAHLVGRDDLRARFSREARAVARLRHPHIVEIYDASDAGDARQFLACEFIDGATLREWVEQHEFPPVEIAVCVARALAQALSCAHESGIVHRDVKPENVMIRRDGAVKLMDFGIAQMVDQSGHMTHTGALLGSPAFMCPEHIEGKKLDHRADLFSLGSVLYWLATGKLPFEARSAPALLKKILDADVTPAAFINPAVDRGLNAVLERLLRRDPAERFAAAGALTRELDLWLADCGIDDPDALLLAYFADPAGQRAPLIARTVAALVARGQADWQQGNRSRALDRFNRVLASDPENVAARAALEKIQRSSGYRRLATYVGGGLGIAAAVTVASWFAVQSWEKQEGTAEGTPAGELLAAENLTPRPVAPLTPTPFPREGGERGAAADTPNEPRAAGGRVPGGAGTGTPAGKPDRTRREEGRDGIRDGAREPTGGHEETPPAAAAAAAVPAGPPRVVRVLTRPWAYVAVDGKQIGEGSREHRLELAPGKHELRLSNPYFVEKTIALDLPTGDGEYTLPIQTLDPRPAQLEVIAAADASVFIDGKFTGTAGASRKQPFVVFLDGAAEKRVAVTVTTPGGESTRRDVTLKAGVRDTLDVGTGKGAP